MADKSVFQFIETDEDVNNAGVINNSDVIRMPEAGSFEELDAELDPKVGFMRLKIKGTNDYVHLVIAAKANFAA